jgi:hypothetical protein
MATLFLVAAIVTAGFAAAVAMVSMPLDCADEDSPHAANAENTAHPSVQRNRRKALAEISAG